MLKPVRSFLSVLLFCFSWCSFLLCLQITKDILWFLLILLALVASFAQMFYTLLLPASCAANLTDAESGSDQDQCSQAEYYLKVYTVLLGDFGHFDREDFSTVFSVGLIVFFSFMIVVVLLNVLIAIVSDSYEKCLVRSQCLFGRARVMLVSELVSFQNLLRSNSDEAHQQVSIVSIFTQWWSGEVWNKGMSHGSTYFFTLSSLVVIGWTIGETAGYFSGEQRGVFVARLLSIAVNVILFAAIIWFLSNSNSSGHNRDGHSAAGEAHSRMEDDASTTSRFVAFDHRWFQRGLLKILGTTQESASLHKTEEWSGRVDFLQREMIRISEESHVVWMKHMEAMERQVMLSESRIRSELTALEDSLDSFREDMATKTMPPPPSTTRPVGGGRR